jgi:hypothetical protein
LALHATLAVNSRMRIVTPAARVEAWRNHLEPRPFEAGSLPSLPSWVKV